MRIITGTARGRKLITLEGMDVRPTPDKIKESLFNIIQFDIPGRKFLDLFAGSGQIGLEALSRGAESCVFVDASKRSIDIIEKNIATCGFENESKVVNAESVMYIRRTPDMFDIAFLDPPYRQGLIEQVLPQVAERMNKGGTIICEHPVDEEIPEEAGSFRKFREYKYGKIILTTYKSAEE
ncbi:MAG: 16S rRNA (guanine(966)-N(2))-methyltransferase RsmD [Clostridia bacterium]|nr:16S rRNA (guanine(966)-N(2))-methyltransferase RsmD [Clostridia bacterium]